MAMTAAKDQHSPRPIKTTVTHVNGWLSKRLRGFHDVWLMSWAMDARILQSSDGGALARPAAFRSGAALAAALTAGAIALVSPPAALLILAFQAARLLMRTEQRFDMATIAGPALAAAVVGAFVGLAGAVGVLFVWRLHADVSWSLREAARLAQTCGRSTEASSRSLLHGWATPAYGLALVAFTSPHVIAGLPLDLPHVPIWVPVAAGCVAAGALCDWLLRRAADWRLGELSIAPTLHMLAHHAIFLIAFGAMFDLSAGIVALAAWRLAHAAPLCVRLRPV